ncbi:MAG: AAA-like domain-containing protein [Pseudomonadota bacterium]
MGDTAGNTGATTRSARPNFFHAGGPLPPDRPGYVRRAIDKRVDDLLDAGLWVNLVGAPGTGKTSLALRVAERQREAGMQVALIDFSQIAQRDSQDDAARWFYAVAFRLARQLRSGFDLQSWWSENAMLAPPQRLLELFREFVIAAPGRELALLFDDIHLLDTLPQGEFFLQGLRLAFDARTTDPEMIRLRAMLIGTGVDQFGRESSEAFPFAVASEVVVTPFTLAETLRLGPALGLPRSSAELAMQRIYDWVAGHPALTQCVAQALAREDTEAGVVGVIDRLVAARIESGRDRQMQAVLTAIERCLTGVARRTRDQVLVTMGRVAKGRRVLLDGRSEAHDRLLRAGAVALSPDGFLLPASRVARHYFDAGWANRHMPIRIEGLVKAAVLIAALVILQAAYRVHLPKGHVADMTAPGATADQIMAAHDDLAWWPGYAGTARRTATAVLSQRAQRAQTPEALEQFALPLETRLDAGSQARSARMAYWRRQLAGAERRGDRPGAVLAAIAALGYGDNGVRRRLSGLLGSDLRELTGVLATGAPFDTMTYRPRDGRFVTRSGTALRTWARPRGQARVAPESEKSPLALATQSVVLRFELPAQRRGQLPKLSLDAAHPRPSDIEVMITTPAGDQVTLAPAAAAASGSRREYTLSDAAGLDGAIPAGTWTVALTDVERGMSGSVGGVTLGEATPAEPLASIALPDPEPAVAEAVVLDQSGDRAIAWPAAEGNRAAVWDLRGDSVQASFAVSVGTRLLGLVSDDREVLLIDGVSLSTRRLADGSRVDRQSLQRPVVAAWPSVNGRWVAAQEAERDARLFILDLANDALITTLDAGIGHEHVRVSDEGNLVVTADVDRTLRVWRAGDAAPLATLPVDAEVRELRFSPTETHVLAKLAGGGMLAWRFADDAPPERWGGGANWSMVEDPQSGLSLLGSPRDGFRVHDFVERRDRSLPLLGVGDGLASVLRVRDNLAVVTDASRGIATLWRPRLEALPTGANNVQRAWLSEDGRAIAFADARDAFTVLRLDAGIPELADLEANVMSVAHAAAPSIVRMSRDGRYAVSVEPSGLFRVRDVRNGQFFDFIGRAGRDVIDARFAMDGTRFVLLRRQSIAVYDTNTGQQLSRELRDVPLTAVVARDDGWVVSDIDGQLYSQPPVDGGVPVALEPLRIDVPAGSTALADSGGRWLVAAEGRRLQLIDLVRGEPVSTPVEMPGEVRELRFSADGQHVVVRAGHWLVRLRAGGLSLVVRDVRLLPADMLSHSGFALTDALGSGVTLLRGLDEPVPATIWFDYRDMPALSASAGALAARWGLLAPLVRSVPVPAFE